MILLAALALQAGSVETARAAAIEQAILDLCPKMLTGSLSISDAAQLKRFGYRPAAVPEDVPEEEQRAVRGKGDRRIYLIFRPKGEEWRCAVIWGGRDSDALLDAIAVRARRRGYSVIGPERLFDTLRGAMIEGDPPLHNLFAKLYSSLDKDDPFLGIGLVPHAAATLDLEAD